jgi:hypothetical protein
MRELLRRVWCVIRQPQLDSERAEERDFHRAMRQRELEKPATRRPIISLQLIAAGPIMSRRG